jgi:hypothetical protein
LAGVGEGVCPISDRPKGTAKAKGKQMDSVFKFNMGDTVTDRVTNFRGEIVGRFESVGGVFQYHVQGMVTDGKYPEPVWINEAVLTKQ